MPVVQSHFLLQEKLLQYRSTDQAQCPSEEEKSKAQAEKLRLDLQDLVASVSSQILQTDPATVAGVAARKIPQQALADLIAKTAGQISVRSGYFNKDLQQQVMDFLFGYGPLQAYVTDDKVSDIDATGPDSFTVKIAGQRRHVPLDFSDEKAYDAFCRLLIIRNGGIINENDSHCRVTDEEYRLRINVTVPPRSVRYPSLSIRKHSRNSLQLEDLVELAMLDEDLAGLLSDWAGSGRSLIICGKGAAGKTTLLRAFIEQLPELERVLIAESDSELYPEKPCCLKQKIKKEHEGGRPVSLLDLVRDGLTMSLDTYCVGEIVGPEAMAYIQAAFSGHRCLATIHADRATDVPERLLALARPASSGETDATLRRLIGRSLDLIICLRDFKISEIIALQGYQEEEERYEFTRVWPDGQGAQTGSAAGRST